MNEAIIGKGRVVLMSSDQVFDGEKGTYAESDEPNPVHNYGLTKLAAEGIMPLYDGKILRISRCFDGHSKDIREYLEEIEMGDKVRVPDFIFRSYCHMDCSHCSLHLEERCNRWEKIRRNHWRKNR